MVTMSRIYLERYIIFVSAGSQDSLSRFHKCSVTVTFHCGTSVFGSIFFLSVSETGRVLEAVMHWEYSTVFLIYMLKVCPVYKEDNILYESKINLNSHIERYTNFPEI